jgi:hypothetical protein
MFCIQEAGGAAYVKGNTAVQPVYIYNTSFVGNVAGMVRSLIIWPHALWASAANNFFFFLNCIRHLIKDTLVSQKRAYCAGHFPPSLCVRAASTGPAIKKRAAD